VKLRRPACALLGALRKRIVQTRVDRGFLDATSLAEYLVTNGGKGWGLPFRTAHHIVGTLVTRCEKEGKHALSQLSVEAFNEVIEATEEREKATERRSGVATKGTAVLPRLDQDVYSCLGAHNVVKRYQSAGAAGGKPFEDQLKAWKERLGV